MPKLLLLPGDGIGPEVVDEVKRVAERLTNELAIDERPFGGASYRLHGAPLTDATLAEAKVSDAVLMGAVSSIGLGCAAGAAARGRSAQAALGNAGLRQPAPGDLLSLDG